MTTPTDPTPERLRRWRLILGGDADGTSIPLTAPQDQGIDRVLDALYGGGEDRQGGLGGDDRKGGLGASAPHVARWLGDIRTYFPKPVVQILQRDAVERLNLKRLLLEPELLETVEPDVHLVATILSLSRVIPDKTRATARQVVRRLVEELEKRLKNSLRQAILGSLNRAVRRRRPRPADIDWQRTIRANLKHYQPEYKTVIPETLIGFTRRRSTNRLRDIIVCVDQSGSMASSVVYASICAAVMAGLRAVKTYLVMFDTAVVDLTPSLHDPVDVLFGTQLGGGTDIARAIAYCQDLIRTPGDTILVLISDLYEGGDEKKLLQYVATLVNNGVQIITLLALSDDGAPAYDHNLARDFAALGIPCFACTPNQFPALMAAAIKRENIQQWAASQGIVTVRGH